MWLLRELHAQVSRFGLALGVVAAALIVVGACLPLIERIPPGFGGGAYSENPVRLENALIGYREGWFLIALAMTIVLMLLGYRRVRRLRPVVALLIAGIGATTILAGEHFAQHNPVDYCAVAPQALSCTYQPPPDWGVPIRVQLPATYAFTVVDLGSSAAVLSGLLLLIPGVAPRPRKRAFVGREAVLWL
jgi:hypothetical protein